MNLIEPLQPPAPPPLWQGHALQPGAMLEDFEIIQVLELTSFGVLYLATHVLDRNTVALKEYLPSSIAIRDAEGNIELLDPSHEEAFQRGFQSFVGEALTLSQFSHPHLLHVNCVWEANGTAYRAMPYLVGSTLSDRRSVTKEPASQAQLKVLLDGLLDVLEMLNNAGLAHGRIDPTNIFMLQGEQPVLMDFDAVRQAFLSAHQEAYVDAYADLANLQSAIAGDLHAVAAVLHFAISGRWSSTEPGKLHAPLADELMRLKDSASALGYDPEFLSAIDAALALPLAEGPPRSVSEFRALFEPTPAPAPVAKPADPAAHITAPRVAKRVMPEYAASEYPLNPSESVLALLAKFDRGPASEDVDIEPFENPSVPTLTEEAEPSLPPLRASLFDAVEAGDSLPHDGVGYGRARYTPMPPDPANRWRRFAPAMGFGLLVLACLAALVWVLTS
jgi:serine/threonine protein kinase